MFCVGLALTIAAAAKEFRGRKFFGQTLSIGELELLNLTRLYFFRPVEQTRIIMADMSQITVAINTHPTQLSLRLLETNSEKRATMGEAAEHVRKVAKGNLTNIQTYFEEREVNTNFENDRNRPEE
jgi:hypothetical protein